MPHPITINNLHSESYERPWISFIQQMIIISPIRIFVGD